MESFKNWNAEDEVDFNLFQLTDVSGNIAKDINNRRSDQREDLVDKDLVSTATKRSRPPLTLSVNIGQMHGFEHEPPQLTSTHGSFTDLGEGWDMGELDLGYQAKKRNISHGNSMSFKPGKQRQMPQKNTAGLNSGHYPRSTFYLGPSSIYDSLLVSQMKLNGIDQLRLSDEVLLRKVDPNSHFLLREDYTQELFIQANQDIEDAEKIVKPYGPTLIDMYFKYIHSFYPILHKKVFLEKYERGYKEVSAPLLSAVYLLAIELWDKESKLIDSPKPDVAALYKIAKSTFTEVLERPKLTAVQAGLLLLQCNSSVPNAEKGYNRKWVLCSQVVSLMEELGLGIDCSSWKLPKWEKGLRRRLAWATFFQDKWISLIESRPTHLIPGINWLVKDLLHEDFLEGSNSSGTPKASNFMRHSPASSINSDFQNDDRSEIGKLFFMQIVKLASILSEILASLYSLESVNKVTTIYQVLNLAKPLQLKLRIWYSSLPAKLSNSILFLSGANFLEAKVLERFPNSSSLLKLAYFVAEITLHRRIITTLPTNESRELIEVCRAAAKTRLAAAIEFISLLRSEHIHSFWYGTASSDFATVGAFALLLYVSALDNKEKIFYKDQIFNFCWCLKIISKNFFPAKVALRRFDALYCQIPELANERSPANSNTPESLGQPLVISRPMSPQNLNTAKTDPTQFSSGAPINLINGPVMNGPVPVMPAFPGYNSPQALWFDPAMQRHFDPQGMPQPMMPQNFQVPHTPSHIDDKEKHN